MSTTTVSAATYWCHDCDMSILLSQPQISPLCPHCHTCPLEHMDAFPHTTNLDNPSIWASNNSSSIFPSLSDLAATSDNFPLSRPYLHQLIHHLTNSATGVSARSSRASVESLKTIRVGCDWVECCSICKDQFGDGSAANELPCGHVFHNGCIVPWLEINNTCPLCRFKLESEEEELGGDWMEREEAYIGALRLDELLDDDGNYESEFRELMRIERGGFWNGRNEAGSGGGRMMFSPTQIGEAGTGGVVDRANSVETVSSWPLWQAEGEREAGTSDVENVVSA